MPNNKAANGLAVAHVPPACCHIPGRSKCQDLGASCSTLPCCTGLEPPLQCLDGEAGRICSRIPVSAAPARALCLVAQGPPAHGCRGIW